MDWSCRTIHLNVKPHYSKLCSPPLSLTMAEVYLREGVTLQNHSLLTILAPGVSVV